MMQPFRVVFWLGSPVCINHPWLHLDGLTAHAKHLEHLGREYRYLPSKAVHSGPRHAPPLFLKTNGVRHAGVSIFGPEAETYTATMFKRFEPEGYPETGAQRVNLGSGHFRNYMLRSVLVSCERVEFHGNGDMERVGRLLRQLPHLGNDGRVGHGDIIGLDIEPEEEDRSLVVGGIAMRPIPVSALREWSEAVHLAWHAPYWTPGSVALCAPPGAEVVLK
ncbi:MAG: hypothetical protein ABFE07_08390 [Armatimonadia bacterium]